MSVGKDSILRAANADAKKTEVWPLRHPAVLRADNGRRVKSGLPLSVAEGCRGCRQGLPWLPNVADSGNG